MDYTDPPSKQEKEDQWIKEAGLRTSAPKDIDNNRKNSSGSGNHRERYTVSINIDDKELIRALAYVERIPQRKVIEKALETLKQTYEDKNKFKKVRKQYRNRDG
jgi:hypothetical protein